MSEMPTFPPTPRQTLQIEQYSLDAETFGQFNQGSGADGAHYSDGAKNPFKAQGLMCQNCYFFDGARACEIVAGNIDPEGVCKLWVIPEQLITASKKEKTMSGNGKQAPIELNLSMKISATDFPKREISGRIVTWNEVGSTSAGDTSFLPNSITFADSTKLLLEHKREAPIGFLKSYSVNDLGIDAVFSVGATTAGSDALVEASTGLRDGFSVGVLADKYQNIDGVFTISASSLKEVSLVSEPAIASARVAVAASESQDSVTESQEEVADVTPPTTEGDEVDTTVPEASAETVEAAKPASLGHVPMAYTKPRSPIVTKVDYLEHTIRAAMGNDDSRQYVMAADNTTSTAPGMIPTFQSTTVINALANADRGMIDALSRETLVAEGMTFELPRITAVPSVGQIDELDPVTESSLSATYLSVPVKSFKGRAISTVELIDRSNPSYFAALLQNLEFAYAKVTDEFATGTIVGAGQQASAHANTAPAFLAYGAEAAAAVYGSSLGFAQNLVVSPAQWANIMGYNVDGRPIYTAGQPQNSGGSVSAQSLRGNVAPGLNLFVSRSIGNAGATTSAGDNSMVVINPDAWTWYESQRFQLRTAIQSDGTIDLLYYGYAAIAPKIPFGACWNQV
ncbi:Prohead protease [uncultured Caudovirales phage]|uniref:Prohead protease n=1 Tax=uncultured Caudovirales phage TaxID=2100421 RepID=A0A6J5T6H1_9CAUD|nr:Prohead protease [uncultured Caudovirales phage]